MQQRLKPAWNRLCRGAALFAAAAACALPAQARAVDPAPVEVRRTTDGIPHVRAATWRGLGFGYGYAQAQDALCTLAEGFVTFGGRRSAYFGPEGRPEAASTFGKSSNLDLDFFFKAFADGQAVSTFRRQQPDDLNALVAGYAQGYNRYLRTVARRGGAGAPHACARAPWLRAITPDDVYRRMIAALHAGGYAIFIPEIVNARPDTAPAPVAQLSPLSPLSLQARLQRAVGESEGLGSNMLAFGRQATGQDSSVLFGNPHWYWGGPDRFYQVHLTLPGRLDVAGVSFLGIPLVMIGFNDHVAWSHTVSGARRFGLFELALDPHDRTRYLVDGLSEPMRATPLTVEARRPDGTLEAVHRTLYRTRFGPVIDLGRRDPALGWSAQRALAIRDVNADNGRAFRNFFRWNQARSLDDFIAIQRQEAAMPWVNTAAIGRGDGRVWYADIGAVPDVPDALRAACAAPLSAAFARLDPRTPLLDGSRSACQWRTDPAAAQPGAIAASHLPSLLRDDYVANMNDSYWLSNPAQPLEGFPLTLGGERMALSLRGREGHRLAAEILARGDTSAEAVARQLMPQVLGARAYSADQFKPALLDQVCAASDAAPSAAEAGQERAGKERAGKERAGKAGAVDLAPACRVLRAWSGRAASQERGALLWDAFWSRVERIPQPEFYAVPFSAAAPLQTPRAPNGADPRVAQALAAAVQELAAKGLAVDAALDERRYVRSAGRKVALFGGCGGSGYFTVTCIDGGDHASVKTAASNSYLQVVYFDAGGVRAHTLLAHGERETAVDNGAGLAPVARYARKDWLPFPFHERDIGRDPALTRLLLRP